MFGMDFLMRQMHNNLIFKHKPMKSKTTPKMITFEYGAMSSKYSCKAVNKLTAYATMVAHYDRQAHLLIIYSPIESKQDQWANFTGQISERLDEIFGGVDSFNNYFGQHIDEIKACYKSIKKLV